MKLRIRDNARTWELSMTPEQFGYMMAILSMVGDELPVRAEGNIINAKGLYRDICAAMDAVERNRD